MPEYRPVSPGSPLRLDAATWNRVQDAARAHDRTRLGVWDDDPRNKFPAVPANLVYLRNDTGGDLPAFSVLALGDPVISPVDFPNEATRTPVFAGDAPADATDAFAVTVEPIPDGGVGRGAVVGVVVCEIDVSDAGHGYAVPAVGITATLASAATGPARVIWKESGTGTKRAAVLIDRTGAGEPSGCDGSGWGWAMGLLDTDCLYLDVIKVGGTCSGTNATQWAYLRWDGSSKWVSQQWDCDGKAWVDYDFATSADASPVQFWRDGDDYVLELSGIAYRLKLVCGSATGRTLVFQGGGPEVCTPAGSGTPDPCQDNTFQIRLTCSCCPIDGWQGPGYYCVLDEGGDCETDAPVPVYLADPCETGIVICSCRYDTEAGANAVCPGPVTTTCCPDDPIPGRLLAVFSNPTGSCACFDGLEVTLTNGLGTSSWGNACIDLSTPCNVHGLAMALTCTGGGWQLSWAYSTLGDPDCPTSGAACVSSSSSVGATACDPFSVTLTVFAAAACCNGSIDVTITPVP